MPIKVKNINGTSAKSCNCGSWLNHWKKNSGSRSSYCHERTCVSPAAHGAHVLKENDKNWYIVPLCAAHNGLKGKEIEVIDATIFISANVLRTCG